MVTSRGHKNGKTKAIKTILSRKPMAMYPGIPTIRTQIIKRDGQHITRIWYNGKIKDEVPTHPKWIRERESLLWRQKNESI